MKIQPKSSLNTSVKTALTLVTLLVAIASCQSSKSSANPVGRTFPSVTGEDLNGNSITIPAATKGQPAVLLIGIVQDAQFDADRWLLGLLQAQTPAKIFELPTITGFFAGLFSGSIDSGMRSGIPEEDWSSVVTLYGDDAKRVKAFTGTDRERNMRVILLDAQGQVRWFHNRGYSARKMLELDREVRALTNTPRHLLDPLSID